MIQPEWYVFAFGKPWPNDPTRPIVTLKTSWSNVRSKAGVSGRWHDNRHTFITDLAESGAADGNHPRHCGPRVEADAQALLPHPDGAKRGALEGLRKIKDTDLLSPARQPDGFRSMIESHRVADYQERQQKQTGRT